jgi:hypothetical protein
MKKILFLLVFTLIAFGATVNSMAYSYTTFTSKIGIGKFFYNEGLDNDSGVKYFLTEKLKYHNNLFLGVLKASVGITPANYNGEFSNGNPVSDNVFYKNYSVLGGLGIDPRFGYDQNQLYFSISKSDMTWMSGNNPGGYDEEYDVNYLGLTYNNIYMLNNKVSLTFGLSYFKGISGNVFINNYPIYYGLPSESIGLTLGGESKYKAKIGLRYRLYKNLSLTVNLFYQHFFFKHSNIDTFYAGNGFFDTVQEPSSNTYIDGIEFGLHYDF